MLARDQRLRRERDILKVYKKGRYGSAASLQVKALYSGYETSRLAVVVSKKISKKAVVRNRIRRRLFELVRELWSELESGYDVVVTVRSDVSASPADQLRTELTQALASAGVINKEKKHV